jgi:hypothetical protein
VILRALESLDDRRLATVLGAAMFLTVAWPILLLDVPPYQDLPGHLAEVTVLAHPYRYPELVSNGWLKSNSALVAWTFFVGRLVGVKLAARLFVLGTLAAMAFVLPRVALCFGDRRRMIVAAPLAWPMVHNWFVAMGMLNFALGVALALATLVQLQRQRVAPSAARGVAVALLGAATWYASGVPLLVLGLLVAVETAVQPSWRARADLARRVLPPLAPAIGLVVLAVLRQAAEGGGRHFSTLGETQYQPAVWLLYDAWSDWFYPFTELEAWTLLPAAVLAVVAAARARAAVPFFSSWALGALAALYLLLPWMLPAFGFVNDRLLPFLWIAALVRVPARLPRLLSPALAGAAALYVVGLAIDLFRVSRDFDAYAAGMDAVPEGARMLSLVFRTRVTSKNTWTLDHASGLYVVGRLTSAQDVWADSPAMTLRFRGEPTFFEDRLQLRRFVLSTATRGAYCDDQTIRGVAVDCAADWRAKWDWMWREAGARFDRVLLFDPTEDVMSTVPASWQTRFAAGRLVILEPR